MSQCSEKANENGANNQLRMSDWKPTALKISRELVKDYILEKCTTKFPVAAILLVAAAAYATY